MKIIRLTVRECICEEYRSAMTKEDWENEMDYFLHFAPEDSLQYQQYLALKDVTWEQVVAAVEGKDMKYTVVYKNRIYTLSLTDFVSEIMREGAYDNGSVNSWGLNDREEGLEVEEM